MTLRQHHDHDKFDADRRLAGWKLVVALVVVAAASIGVLMISKSVEAAISFAGTLLVVLGYRPVPH
jgi:hypothetical protein